MSKFLQNVDTSKVLKAIFDEAPNPLPILSCLGSGN